MGKLPHSRRNVLPSGKSSQGSSSIRQMCFTEPVNRCLRTVLMISSLVFRSMSDEGLRRLYCFKSRYITSLHRHGGIPHLKFHGTDFRFLPFELHCCSLDSLNFSIMRGVNFQRHPTLTSAYKTSPPGSFYRVYFPVARNFYLQILESWCIGNLHSLSSTSLPGVMLFLRVIARGKGLFSAQTFQILHLAKFSVRLNSVSLQNIQWRPSWSG